MHTSARLRRWLILLALASTAYFLARGAVTLLFGALPAAPRWSAHALASPAARAPLTLAALERLTGVSTSERPVEP